jgi:hypothetical protein
MARVGVKTSEFWVVFVAGMITAAGHALGLPDPVISWINALALAWLTSRTVVKASVVKSIGKSINTLPVVTFLLGMISYLAFCVFLLVVVFK